MHVSSSFGVFYNGNAHYVIGEKWWNNSWRYYFWFFINHVVLWIMWYIFFFRILYGFGLILLSQLGYDYHDLHFVQDFHLFMINWQTPRNISACDFQPAFVPTKLCKTILLRVGGWRRVLSGNHVLHDESRICKTPNMDTYVCMGFGM